jgi:ATP-dependent RNA helicase MSS116
MPPPPKRKWHPRKTGTPANANAANGSASNTSSGPGTPTTPRSTMAQQPKRPKVDAAPMPEGTIGTMDVKQMYSTSPGGDAAKPFSALSGRLDKALLDGLDKMGFE